MSCYLNKPFCIFWDIFQFKLKNSEIRFGNFENIHPENLFPLSIFLWVWAIWGHRAQNLESVKTYFASHSSRVPFFYGSIWSNCLHRCLLNHCTMVWVRQCKNFMFHLKHCNAMHWRQRLHQIDFISIFGFSIFTFGFSRELINFPPPLLILFLDCESPSSKGNFRRDFIIGYLGGIRGAKRANWKTRYHAIIVAMIVERRTP